MQFFLYEIVARIVAIYLCVVCFRTMRNALVERKIGYRNTDFLEWLLTDWSNRFVHRDGAPVRYWILFGVQTIALVGCLGVAIFGWWVPNT